MSKENGKERVVYHVLPNASGQRWVVSRENSDERAEFDTKDEAVREARRRAHQGELGQINVHGSDGNMQYESTYGEDPASSPS
ncbi:MAG: DUF2188 domain-containing protein [Myxococcales bacterium]